MINQTLKILILTVFFTALNGLHSQQVGSVPVTDFEKTVNNLLKAYYADYTGSDERLFGEMNDKVLEEKGNAYWEMILTMEARTPFKNDKNQTLYQKFYFGFFEFKNEQAAQKAFDNVLNCFGTDCAKIKWDDSQKSVKTTPVIYLKTDKDIVVCHLKCEHKNINWEKLKKDIIKMFGKKGTKVITADCGGKPVFKVL